MQISCFSIWKINQILCSLKVVFWLYSCHRGTNLSKELAKWLICKFKKTCLLTFLSGNPYNLYVIANHVQNSALSTCVHARVPGIPEIGRYTDRAKPLPLETSGAEQILFRKKMPFISKQASADCRLLHNENMLSAESSAITYKLYGLPLKKVSKQVFLNLQSIQISHLANSFERFVPRWHE